MAIFSDLNLRIRRHPGTHDMLFHEDLDAVRQALRIILLTAPGEKPFNPDFGVGIRKFLFEPLDDFQKRIILKLIQNNINKFDQRIKIEDLIVDDRPENSEIYITIFFYARATPQEIQKVDFSFERVR